MLSTSKQLGVTLIELTVGLVILSILFALAAPSYSGWVQNQQVRTAAESILNGVQLARSEAVKNNATARFVLCGLPSTSWEVLIASSPAGAPPLSVACGAGSNALAGEIRVQERSGEEGSRLATVATIPLASTTVTFNSLGRLLPTNADGTAPVTKFDVTTLTASRPLSIVGTAGTPKMCDPSPLLAWNDPRHC